MELAFDLNSRGATTKLVVAMAQRRIEVLQAQVIYPIWKRIITYAVAKAVKAGALPQPPSDWYMLEPTYPRSFTLDNFRDVKADIDLYSKSWVTGTQVAESYGWDYKKNLRQKAEELAYAEELAQEFGLDRAELITLTIQGNAPASPDSEKEKKEDEEEDDKNNSTENSNGSSGEEAEE